MDGGDSEHEGGGGAEATACPRCGRPLALCVCDRTVELDTRLRVLILQHPREQDVELGSARLAATCLRRARLVVGLSWPSLARALGDREVTPSRWVVVFPWTREPPGSRAARAPARGEDPAAAAAPVTVADGDGRPVDARAVDGIVVLDGSWSQAKTLWWRNPWLLKLHRMTLTPAAPSIYGSLRPEPRREYVSTLEAVGAALTGLGEDPGVEALLRRAFRTLVQRARDARRRAVGEGGRRQRLQLRRRARGPKRGGGGPKG